MTKKGTVFRLFLISTTRKDLNSEDTTFDSKHPVYLYHVFAVDTHFLPEININLLSFIFILGSLDDKYLYATNKINKTKMSGNTRLDHLMVIREKFNLDNKIFKLRYDSLGTTFTIQILGTSKYTSYKQINVIGNINKTKVYLFNNDVKKSNLATNKFLSYVIIIFNGPNRNPNVAELASALFYSIYISFKDLYSLFFKSLKKMDKLQTLRPTKRNGKNYTMN